jgi:hypothetical protein
MADSRKGRFRFSRKALGVAGFASIALSLAVSGVWFCWLLPLSQRFDTLWEDRLSRHAYWDEQQKSIRRFGWYHDDFGPVGHCGDEAWARWIIKRIEAGEKIGECGNGHKDSALAFITAHKAVKTGNSSLESQWLEWWRANKDKSQREWIQQGLTESGVSVHFPPADADHEPLLALLGSPDSKESDTRFVRYNAFRWLRDSGFEAVAFAMSKVTPETPAAVREGLLKYAEFEREWPAGDQVGLLDLDGARPRDSGARINRPFFSRPATQVAGYVLMILPLITGLAILSYLRGQCAASKGAETEE